MWVLSCEFSLLDRFLPPSMCSFFTFWQKNNSKVLQITNLVVPLQPQLRTMTIGRLASAGSEQSALSSRGSAVRIRQRPLNEFLVNHCFFFLGRLAQLVQSICLTSRGSAVRIRQRPLQASQFCGAFFFLILFLYANINSGR